MNRLVLVKKAQRWTLPMLTFKKIQIMKTAKLVSAILISYLGVSFAQETSPQPELKDPVLSQTISAWENPPMKISKTLISDDFFLKPGGVPHAYIALAILRLENSKASIEDVMKAKSVPRQDSGHNWFYYLGDILSEVSKKKFTRNYHKGFGNASYPIEKLNTDFQRNLREQFRSNTYTTITLSGDKWERVALLLDIDWNRKVLKVYTPMENKGQPPSALLQEWKIESLWDSRFHFGFYNKAK